jgi:hypothetical protein
VELNERTIFLLDGIGALVSLVSLGVVLPAFQERIGMPGNVLYFLASLALVCALYSLSRYRLADLTNPFWLRGIIGLNLGYCVVSLYLIIKYFQLLTSLGLAYFLLEKLVVLAIVGFEVKMLKRLETRVYDVLKPRL